MILTACVHPCLPVYAQGEGEIITLFSLGGNWLCLETFEHPIKLISFANESDDTKHFKVKFCWAFHLAGLWGNAPSTAFVNQVPGVRIYAEIQITVHSWGTKPRYDLNCIWSEIPHFL